MTIRQFTARDAAEVDQDDEAFGMLHVRERMTRIREQLADPRTHYFGENTMRWVVAKADGLYDRSIEADRLQRVNGDLEEAIKQLTSAAPMPKSKAIVKQAKIIARQAECIAAVVHAIHHAADGAPGEYEAGELLDNALSKWAEDFRGVIEDAS